MTFSEHHHDEPDNGTVSRALLSRRSLLALGGAGMLTVGAGALAATAAGATTPPADPGAASATGHTGPGDRAGMCGLTAEQIEGPYYLDYELFRRDVVEDRTGVPLRLCLTVVDTATCRPLRDSAVEIWQCDALGVYSGYGSIGNGGGQGTPGVAPGPPPGGGHQPPTDDLTYLRGIQMTDAFGTVEFRTIVPGWYAGRAVHIHTKVHTGGRRTPGGYTGGHQCHTGQFYFSEEAVRLVARTDPYTGSTIRRTTLEEDLIYPGTGAAGGLLDLAYDPRHIRRGVLGRLTMSVDAAGTHDGSDAPLPPFPTPSAR
ncbi:intradiol ring-cleavage dioxygenase [Streptantibioticus cattleyicolor]|uniref:Dioxygenase n=1 Tax=Streptantibioticus cattleyicolor (strain ATCC 35852 / DSM 46488 / JCM 4925 / NBRC 14057 / NRRL 8057) TaxID=1003195 RepID=F8JMP3_STREN|nr:intradiol ring-cleavage dioxygenase [Streptantibioticus cattleyicolor]AEW98759.1 dioxygenase [Streptantibioticus cattleyicolor NRRL 8057 = DSM 46488]CCB72189.1 Dioxygenase [Streptantibioticus cattleyicolor NRRL 8057 = DSM 46488]